MGDELFREWLQPVDGKVVIKKMKLLTMGVNTLRSHMQSDEWVVTRKNSQVCPVAFPYPRERL